jgi:hypothetical protein
MELRAFQGSRGNFKQGLIVVLTYGLKRRVVETIDRAMPLLLRHHGEL